MKKKILNVLENWKDSQINIESEPAREMLAEAIVKALFNEPVHETETYNTDEIYHVYVDGKIQSPTAVVDKKGNQETK